MAKKYGNCTICGKEYEVCHTCAKVKSFTPWRTIADTINCYKIYAALSSYTNKYADKDETKKILSECDLSELETFNDNIKSSIKEILKEDKPKKFISYTKKQRDTAPVDETEEISDKEDIE